jgi:methionyl aminopeptidase
MMQLKSARELEVMAEGGRLLAATHRVMAAAVAPGVSTAAVDKIGEDFLRSHQGATPAFKGLYGFPGSACISVNEEIVHGIPSPKKILREGDIVSLDFGVKLDGLYTDAAITVGVGEISAEAQRLLDVTRESLARGIAAMVVGNHIGDIGHAIGSYVTAEGYSTAVDLVGHYVGYAPHGDPQVPNEGKPKRGPRLVPGMTLAVEPMVCQGTGRTRTLSDKWTVVTADGKWSAHFEHSVAITADGPLVLTTE